MASLTLAGPSSRWMLAGGYDYLATCGELGEVQFPEVEAELIDLTGPACTAEKMVPSGFLNVSDLTAKAWYQSDTLAKLKAIRSLSTTNRVTCWGIEGLATGRWFFGKAMIDAKWAPEIAPKELVKVDFALKPETGSLDVGKILVPHATKSGTTWNTNSDSVDNTTSSANGAALYLQVTAVDLDGGTNSAILASHSTDNITFATLGTFTVVTAAPAAERIIVSGTVNRYTAASGSYGGSPTTPTTTLFMGIKRY